MNRKTIIIIALFLIAIWCFFVSWVRLGDINSYATMTGFDMVRGAFGMPGNPLSNNPGSEALALLAFITAIAGLITCFFKSKVAFIIRISTGVAGAALLAVLNFTIPGYIHGLSEWPLTVSFLPGYWLAIVTLFIASIVSFAGKRP